MLNKTRLKIIVLAVWRFCNQPLFSSETVLNPVIFWHIYQNRQILEQCWNYDLIQCFEKCWNINAMQLSDNCISLENNSHSIGI